MTTSKALLSSVLLGASTMFGSCAAAMAQPGQLPPADRASDAERPVLVVSASGQIDVAPNELQVALSVLTEAQSAEDAVRENNQLAERVVAALNELGLGDKAVTTSTFQISPRYSQPDYRGGQPQEDPRIVGYRVSNQVLVRTGRLDVAGAVIEAAVNAGANQVQHVSFGLRDPQQHRTEAIRRAMERARRDADTLAAAAGVRIEGVKTLSLGSTGWEPLVQRQPMYRMAAMDAAESAGQPPLNPGDVTVTASVTVEYHIASSN